MVYQADWSSGRGGWIGGSDWQAVNGTLINDGTNTNNGNWLIAPFTPPTADYAVEVDATVARTNDTGCSVGFGIVARSGAGGAYRSGVYYDYNGPYGRLWRTPDYYCSFPLGQKNFDPGSGSHRYRLEAQGNTVRYLIDGNVVLTTQDNRFLSIGQLGLWSDQTQLTVTRFAVYQLDAPTPPAVTPNADYLYLADWTNGLGGWIGGQDWKTVGGMLVNDGTSNDNSHWIVAPYTPGSPNYAVEFEAQVIRSEDSGCSVGFGAVARSGSPGAYRAGVYNDYNGPYARLWRTPDYYCSFPLGQQNVNPGGDWHTYRLEVRGNTLRFLIDGNLILTTIDNRFLDAGQVGLWSNATQIDVRRFEVDPLSPPDAPPSVTPKPNSVYLADWSGGLNGWAGGQDWKAVGGMLVNDGTNSDVGHWVVAPYTPSSANYAVEFEAQVVRTEDNGCSVGFGAVTRYTNSGAYRGVYYDYNGPFARLWRTTDYYCSFPLGQQNINPGSDWHTYRLEVQGSNIRFLVDGNTVLATTDTQFSPSGQIGLWSDATQIDVRRFEVISL